MFGKTSRQASRNNPRNRSRINRLGLLAGLLVAGLSVPALGQSVPFPTYETGPNANTAAPVYPGASSPWVVSNGTIITPVGNQVNLGATTRAKAIALNPLGNHTAAVLQMGAPQAVTIFNTQTGAVLQTYKYPSSANGSATGITYTPDGKHLLFSQDSSYVAIVNVSTSSGKITTVVAHVSVPRNLTFIQCFPNSPPGTTGSARIPPCQTYSSSSVSYPLGLAISPDNKTAYVVLDVNDTLAKIDLTKTKPVQGPQIRVGNVPHSVVISADGKTAYVSNEAGRVATANDFQEYSDGTPVVAINPTGATATGTVSVVDLASFTVKATIPTGLHPTGMAFWGNYLLVANAYSDSISVIDTATNTVAHTLSLGLPITAPGSTVPAWGAGPNSIAVDQANNIAYVALYNVNAIAVVNLSQNASGTPVMGMIPVSYAPSSVVLDRLGGDNVLLVANDKGLGSTGIPGVTQNQEVSKHGVGPAFNTREDLGTVNIVPVPTSGTLAAYTKKVYQNNHWDLAVNIASASGGNPSTPPVAIPAKIGDPSLIKHVFVIIRENRTYDQILGDVAGGNGSPSLAIFGDGSVAQAANGGAGVTPNAHALVQRFPLFDNFYDPSRQSADGHNWILQAMAPYSDDIQSPDWIRDYPAGGGDSLAYQPQGNLYDLAAKAGISLKNYGEYIEYNSFLAPTGSITEPSWTQFYNDSQCFEGGPQCAAPGTAGETTLYYQNTVSSHSPLPNVISHTVQNYPQFDLGIPDQFRVDIWQQDFAKDVKAGTVPALSFMWISSDHTGGPPTAQAEQADNDLALGRFVDIISHSPIWSSSAIFVEEDDAQDGVDHVDGHRSPGYIISPYTMQSTTGTPVVDHTHYTQVNMTRTIEQILGLTPMNWSDLVASPMSTAFTNNPPATSFLPWSHVPNQIPLNQGVTATAPAKTHSPTAKALQASWLQKKAEIFAGKYTKPDSEDPDTVRHYNWYEATGFTVPYPGEKTVRPASAFNNVAPAKADDDE